MCEFPSGQIRVLLQLGHLVSCYKTIISIFRTLF